MNNRFIIADPKSCIGCHACEVACVIAHSDNDVHGLAKENFLPRIRVIKGKTISTAVLCRHCDDAPCLEVCPNGAIIRENGSIQVIQEKCIGCKTCAIACPYGAMSIVTKTVTERKQGPIAKHYQRSEAHKCDLCNDKPEGPSCIKVCPTNALRLITPASLEEMQKKRQQRAALEAAAQFNF